MSDIVENIAVIKANIRQAAERAGRNPEEIKLIAVSKTKPMNLIVEAFEAGQLDFGENKVQEVREKQPELPDAHWHVIGTLQRNKVKYIAPWVHLIHSVDTERLLGEINKQAAKHDRLIDVLLQMNISGEENKHGLEEEEVTHLLTRLDDFPHIRIKGFMGMAEFTDDEQILREQFGRLRTIKETLEKSVQHERADMTELSMGMSGDYEIAIEEGSTMIRVGSAIFGSRNYG